MKKIHLTFGIICSLLILANPLFANTGQVISGNTEMLFSSIAPAQSTAFLVTNNDKFLTIENIDSQPFNIKIYDEEGKLVFSTSSNKNLENIDTSLFSNGKYFYFVTNNKGQHVAGHFTLNNAKSLAVF